MVLFILLDFKRAELFVPNNVPDNLQGEHATQEINNNRMIMKYLITSLRWRVIKLTNRLSKTTSFAKTSRFNQLANVSIRIVVFTIKLTSSCCIFTV